MKTLHLLFGSVLALTHAGAQDLSENKEVLYVTHRGASYLAPENTFASILLAWELGADASECDVLLTADNRIILSIFKPLKQLRYCIQGFPAIISQRSILI